MQCRTPPFLSLRDVPCDCFIALGDSRSGCSALDFNTYTDSIALANTFSNVYIHTNAHAHINTNAHINANDVDIHTHTDEHTHINSYNDSILFSHTFSYLYPYKHPHTNGITYRYTNV